MNWFFLAFACAFFVATTDALCKKILTEKNEYVVLWGRIGFASPFLLLLLFFVEVPKPDSAFYFAIILLLPLETTALILYTKAIKTSPLSVTLPFLAFTPVFLIFTSQLILGERLDKTGMLGVFLIATGAYLLNVHTTKKGVFQPFKAILQERGSVYMLIVAFIFSITSNLGKMAILHSNPMFFAAIYYPVLSLILFPIFLWKNSGKMNQFFPHRKTFVIIGITMFISTLTHFFAVSLAEVPYVISVKRTSLLFGILFGALLFKEKNITERFIGGAVMLAGVVTITLF